MLHRGAHQGGVRHRDARPRRQHAGPLGRDRAAHEVHRRAPRAPHARASTRSSPGGPGGGASTTSATPSCSGRRSCPSSRWPRWRRAAPTRCARRSGPPTTWRPTSCAATSPTRPTTCSTCRSPSSRPTRPSCGSRRASSAQQEPRSPRLRAGGAVRARRRRGVPARSCAGRSAAADARPPRRGEAVDRTFAALSPAGAGRRASSSTAAGWRCCRVALRKGATCGCTCVDERQRAGDRSAPTTLPSRRTRSAPSSCPSRTTRTTAPSSTRWARRCAGPGSSATATPVDEADGPRRGRRPPSAAEAHPVADCPDREPPRPRARSRPSGSARARRPAAPGAGPHRLAGPPVRPRAAAARGVGLPRRLGAHRDRARCWPAPTTSPICSSPRR